MPFSSLQAKPLRFSAQMPNSTDQDLLEKHSSPTGSCFSPVASDPSLLQLPGRIAVQVQSDTAQAEKPKRWLFQREHVPGKTTAVMV